MCVSPSSRPYVWQAVAVLIGVAELVLIMYVFLSVPETFAERRMVSANLFLLSYYRIGVTALVMAQLGMVIAYMARFRHVDGVGTVVAMLLVCMTFAGWVVTIAFDPDTDMVSHIIGATIFVCGMVAYVTEMMYMVFLFEPSANVRYDVASIVVYACSVVFAVAYGVLYILNDWEYAWLWENIAFVFMAAGNTLFFWFHPFDPFVPIHEALKEEEQAAPLLFPMRDFV